MTDTSFPDHFTAVAEAYGRYRPGYPSALFSYLSRLAPGRNLAWDCACGSGQAARALAPYFRSVLATDASMRQLDQALWHPRIAYRVAVAESSPLCEASADLITVAQALHWFDLPRFLAEAGRVLVPNGVLAVWNYGVLRMGDGMDELIDHLYGKVLGDYWPPERRMVESGLDEVTLPFPEVSAPAFAMKAQWSRARLLGYLGTWSAVARYRKACGEDPLQPFERELHRLWPDDGEMRTVTWPLRLRVGIRPAD